MRPTSITVISWIIIACGLFGLVFTPFQFSRPMIQQYLGKVGMPLALAIFIAFESSALFAISGIAMLKGFNWGRLLYLCLVLFSLIYDLALLGFRVPHLPHYIFYIISVFLLTRPQALAFFRIKSEKG